MPLVTEELVQVGKDRLLNLSWELVTHCQFNCSYCYFKPYESDINYTDVMKIVLTKIRTMNEPVNITLLGGEPTLHPNFHEIVETLASMDHVKKIDIITNLQSPVEFWKPLFTLKDKLEIIASFHVEYARQLFFKKIAGLKDHLPMNIIFMVHNDIKFLPKLKEAAEEYTQNHLNDVPIIFRRITNDNSPVEYHHETLTFFEEMEKRIKSSRVVETIPVKTLNESFEIPEIEFANQELNKFKGWKCQMNALIINPDGIVHFPCTSKKKHILFTELKGREMTCPHEICPCEAYWGLKKSKT